MHRRIGALPWFGSMQNQGTGSGDATGERSFPLPMHRRRIALPVLFTAHILRVASFCVLMYLGLLKNCLTVQHRDASTLQQGINLFELPEFFIGAKCHKEPFFSSRCRYEKG